VRPDGRARSDRELAAEVSSNCAGRSVQPARRRRSGPRPSSWRHFLAELPRGTEQELQSELAGYGQARLAQQKRKSPRAAGFEIWS